ncbi:MAG: NADH-quinone oxidoreductase subunit NuoE [Proteobacteria bacterium]|jgi:NADH-quinone oxidoreductase subunit E|nr:NADH-quinone oxidoreductase subunit NuoE [Pseudomonadota bacterium]HUT84464.1 NADH-quinone oxidoreductase subunit NuoE [Thermodesulfobacteriota bacterium]
MDTKDKVDAIIEKYKRDKGFLVSILQDIQAEYNYLPKEALFDLSDSLGIPVSQVYGVATFYRAFSLIPRGRHLIQVCLGTACHVRGAPKVLEAIERKLKIKAGETTADKEYTLTTVNCLGACALGPVVVIDQEYHGQMNQSKSDKLFA